MSRSGKITREQLLPTLQETVGFIGAQSQRILSQYPDYAPMYTVNGKWNQEGELWTHWCEGFFPGILWLLHEATGNEQWLAPARKLSHKLEPRRFDRNVHDLGFLFLSTYLREYRLTGEKALRTILIEAGRTLALRRQVGGYLCSFIGPESLFIDIMMNVGIIFWAANETDDPTLRAIALEHCQTTAKYLVREDGGTAHEGIFDLQTGAFEHESTHQGWNAESTWTRGLAWAIYGFTTVHRLVNAQQQVTNEFLAIAQRCADCYLSRASEGLVPLWDFDLPADAPQLWDSSAGAIVASGLWDLSACVREADRNRYQQATLTILETLCTEEFVPYSEPEQEGMLKHGIYHFHKRLGVDESVAWGDHFFVEAIVKVIGTATAT